MNESKELYVFNNDKAEDFIALVKNHYDLQLDFSMDSIQVFEKAIDTLMQIPEGVGEALKTSMYTYLGHLLLTLFGGEWFQNDIGKGVCLKNTALGENIEVFPSAWIDKRIRNRLGDSIEFKITVLADFTLMKPKYKERLLGDIKLSEEYAKSLSVSLFEKNYIDNQLLKIINKEDDFVID